MLWMAVLHWRNFHSLVRAARSSISLLVCFTVVEVRCSVTGHVILDKNTTQTLARALATCPLRSLLLGLGTCELGGACVAGDLLVRVPCCTLWTECDDCVLTILPWVEHASFLERVELHMAGMYCLPPVCWISVDQ